MWMWNQCDPIYIYIYIPYPIYIYRIWDIDIYIYISQQTSQTAAFISGMFWSFECNISTQWTHFRRLAIDSMRKFHVGVRISIRWGKCEVDSTFKIDEISMSSPGWFFCLSNVESTQLLYSLFPLHNSVTFSALRTYSKLGWVDVISTILT